MGYCVLFAPTPAVPRLLQPDQIRVSFVPLGFGSSFTPLRPVLLCYKTLIDTNGIVWS